MEQADQIVRGIAGNIELTCDDSDYAISHLTMCTMELIDDATRKLCSYRHKIAFLTGRKPVFNTNSDRRLEKMSY